MENPMTQRKQHSALWWIGVIAGGMALAPILLWILGAVIFLALHAMH